MTELVPILHTSSDELEVGLLRSADFDEPSPAAISRTAVALGLGAGAVTISTGAGAAGAAVASGLKLSSSVVLSALKALAIGTTTGLLVSAGAHAVLSEPAPEPVAGSVAAAPVDTNPEPNPPTRDVVALATSERGAQAALVEGPSETAAGDAPRTSLALGGAPSARSAQRTRRSDADQGGPASATPARAAFEPLNAPRKSETTASPAAPSPAATGSDARGVARAPAAVSIAEEVRMMDRARQALSAGRAREALTELQRYEAQWPRGVFSTEVRVLRVEAKLKLGDRASALREARALIDAQPNSRHAARLRSLLGIQE